MIDLNDVWRPPAQFDLPEIRRRLAATAPDWLPASVSRMRAWRADRKALRCADLSGRRAAQRGVLRHPSQGPYAGSGYDHATGRICRWPIDLIHHATGLSDRALFDEAARLARLDPPPPRLTAAASQPDHSLEVARILDGCQPLAGTPAEAYLRVARS